MDSDSAVISHVSYLGLVQTLLEKVEAHENDSHLLWKLVQLTTNILLIYKFSDCKDYLIESFNATKDVASLFVLSRVFYDHASTLIERHQVLKNCV